MRRVLLVAHRDYGERQFLLRLPVPPWDCSKELLLLLPGQRYSRLISRAETWLWLFSIIISAVAPLNATTIFAITVNGLPQSVLLTEESWDHIRSDTQNKQLIILCCYVRLLHLLWFLSYVFPY
ncbi:hypothetical protein FN846DRAFT_934485 [Sphaerosporella brunnea]|uniref:Uncharacterized protein n=1 Tax=Sphaerosporella brunnea TaxID=1250544 RepID=A0A5J5F5S8_9PEZI|nr:hypothetical protein FN846DRAFT_934485 [Sphaerosporella brunnea]